jgi:hypothetical protein
LVRKIFKRSVNDFGLRVFTDNLQRLVDAAAVDDYDAVGPIKLTERATYICGLVTREY